MVGCVVVTTVSPAAGQMTAGGVVGKGQSNNGRSTGPLLAVGSAAQGLHGGGPALGADLDDVAPSGGRVGGERELADGGVVLGVRTQPTGGLDAVVGQAHDQHRGGGGVV